MTRIEFRLTMPSTASANGRWSGEGRNYIIVKTLHDQEAAALLEGKTERTWFHRWEDGWGARVTARILAPGSRRPPSDGFAGYDWMVANILAHGDTNDLPSSPQAI